MVPLNSSENAAVTASAGATGIPYASETASDSASNLTDEPLPRFTETPQNYRESVTDEPLPRFTETPDGAFTVYMREDSPSTYRCLLCDSYGADFIIIRGFMMTGDTLFYRGVTELPEQNGTTTLHEVVVWELGR